MLIYFEVVAKQKTACPAHLTPLESFSNELGIKKQWEAGAYLKE